MRGRLRSRRGRALWTAVAVVVGVAAIGVTIKLRSGDATPSGMRAAVRSAHFNVLPPSLVGRHDSPVVQVDADRAVVFGGVTWDKKNISVANEGVMIDFASKTSTAIVGPKLDDGLARMRAAVSGTTVLFFGMECPSGHLPAAFDGEGDVVDPCTDARLMLTTLDLTSGAWSDPVTAPAAVGGNVRWNLDAWVVGNTAVAEYYESDKSTETLTAYDIPTGRWRALDPPPGSLPVGACATRTDVVSVTYEDWVEGGGPPPPPRLILLDPNTGRWSSVAFPKQLAHAAGSIGLACTADHPVVQAYPAPDFGSASFVYTRADATWQRLPAAPHKYLTGRSVGVGDVLVSWNTSDPGAAITEDQELYGTSSTSLQTIDLAGPDPQWSSNATTPAASAAFATGVHPGGDIIARADDTLYRVAVGGDPSGPSPTRP